MTVEQTKVIDIISIDDRGIVVLIISDHLEWDTADHLIQLQEKLNSYLAFIENGEILESYPKAAGKEVRVEVVCKFPPDSKAIHFLSHCKKHLADAGFEFLCRTLTSETALLTENALAEDWNRIEEDEAWSQIQE